MAYPCEPNGDFDSSSPYLAEWYEDVLFDPTNPFPVPPVAEDVYTNGSLTDVDFCLGEGPTASEPCGSPLSGTISVPAGVDSGWLCAIAFTEDYSEQFTARADSDGHWAMYVPDGNYLVGTFRVSEDQPDIDPASALLPEWYENVPVDLDNRLRAPAETTVVTVSGPTVVDTCLATGPGTEVPCDPARMHGSKRRDVDTARRRPAPRTRGHDRSRRPPPQALTVQDF